MPEFVPENLVEAQPIFSMPEKKKMRIALLPVINSTQEELPWNIAEEFQVIFSSCIGLSDDFSFLADGEIENFMATESAAGSQPPVDFIVTVDLLEHDIKLFRAEAVAVQFPAASETAVSILKMKAIVQVTDVRDKGPRLVREEIFVSNCHIPKGGSPIDYNRLRWNKKAFAQSAWATAHQKMLADLAVRIESMLFSL